MIPTLHWCLYSSHRMLLLDSVVVVTPVFAYYSQFSLIKRTNSLGSFSIYVTAILLISNILRIFFWLASGFAANLLWQSVFVIVVQMVLLRECVRVGGFGEGVGEDFLRRFWKWTVFEDYVQFLMAVVAVMTVLGMVFQVVRWEMYGAVVGGVAMSIEGMLGLPQLVSNYRTRSVEGLSYTMIGMWFVGDLSKTVYFVVMEQPLQFAVCGGVQLAVDIAIIIQIALYRKVDYDSVTNQTS